MKFHAVSSFILLAQQQVSLASQNKLSEMSVEDDIQTVERSVEILRNQFDQCNAQIEHLKELRRKVELNPTEYFRAAFSCQNSIPLPTPIVIHQIPIEQLKSLGGKWDGVGKKQAEPQLPAKISVKKARRLPGYRLLQKQNISFAKEWKDDDEHQIDLQ